MGRKLRFLLLLVPFTALAQDLEPKTFFSEAVGMNIKKYVRQSEEAYFDKDYERADFLYDSLVDHVIKGTYLDNFTVYKRSVLSKKKVELYDFEKPVFLMTYASWCTPGSGEIPALNEIVAKYSPYIDFVVLFWDSRGDVRKVSKEYSKEITIVYVDEAENKHSHIIERMKHSVGFPTCFFMDEDKRIIDVRRGAFHPYHETYDASFQMNYATFLDGISVLTNVMAIPNESFGID